MLRGATIFPHFDRMMQWRKMLVPLLQSRLKTAEFVLGIDEDTALVGSPGAAWKVMGRQQVYVITKSEVKTYSSGIEVIMPS
jgi:cyanophycinase-like exopeptidase